MTSLVVQWLRLCIFNAEGMDLIHGWGIKIPHAEQSKKKLKNKELSQMRMYALRQCNVSKL